MTCSSARRSYSQTKIDEDPNHSVDSDEKVVTITSGLPITSRCECDEFHENFDDEYKCARRANHSQWIRVSLFFSPLWKQTHPSYKIKFETTNNTQTQTKQLFSSELKT